MSDFPPPPDEPSFPPPPPADLKPPSGYAGFEPGMAAGAAGLRSVSGAAKGSMIAVVITGAVGVVSSLLQLGVVNKAEDFLNGTASEDEFEDAFNTVSAITSVSGLAQIAAVVFSIIWLQRVLSNHRRVMRQTTWAPGWAIGGWFLPPFLFVIPLLMLREAWQASSPDVPPGDQRWKQTPTSPLVWIWWAFFGLLPLVFIPLTLSRFDTFSTDTEDLADFVKDSSAINVASSIVSFGAAIAWALLVRELTARHERLLGVTP